MCVKQKKEKVVRCGVGRLWRGHVEAINQTKITKKKEAKVVRVIRGIVEAVY